jgi:hypothetical protein
LADLHQEDRDLPIDMLAVNHRSDFVRAYNLAHYGGLYLDPDCIVLRDLGPVFDMALEHGFAGCLRATGIRELQCHGRSPGLDGDQVPLRSGVRSRSCRCSAGLAGSCFRCDGHAISAAPDAYTLIPTELIMPLNWNESEALTVRRSDADHKTTLRRRSILLHAVE